MNMDEARWERIERTIEYLTNQQAYSEAKFSSQIEELVRFQAGQHEVIDALFASQQATQRIADQNTIAIRELRETQRQYAEAQREYAEAQRHTEERLNAVIGYIDRRHI